MTNTIPDYLKGEIKILMSLWFHGPDQARGVFAVQQEDGSYHRGKGPVTPSLVYSHLKGKMTLGAYLLTDFNECKLAAWDVDLKISPSKGAISAAELRRFPELGSFLLALYDAASSKGRSVYLVTSGRRGFHIYCFFKSLIPAAKSRALAEKVVKGLEFPKGVSVDLFPRQTEKGNGVGSLLKVCWGKHRVTGARTVFLNRKFEEIKVKPSDIFRNPTDALPDERSELTSRVKEVDFKIKKKLPPFFRRLLERDHRIRDLYEGRGKEKGQDMSRSGFDYSLLGLLINRGVDDPSDLATILWHRGKNPKARDPGGLRYLKHTVGKALNEFKQPEKKYTEKGYAELKERFYETLEGGGEKDGRKRRTAGGSHSRGA